jgi:hypothetical protein
MSRAFTEGFNKRFGRAINSERWKAPHASVTANGQNTPVPRATMLGKTASMPCMMAANARRSTRQDDDLVLQTKRRRRSHA